MEASTLCLPVLFGEIVQFYKHTGLEGTKAELAMLKVYGAVGSCWVKASFSPGYKTPKLKTSNVSPLPLRGAHAPSPTPSAYRMPLPKSSYLASLNWPVLVTVLLR